MPVNHTEKTIPEALILGLSNHAEPLQDKVIKSKCYRNKQFITTIWTIKSDKLFYQLDKTSEFLTYVQTVKIYFSLCISHIYQYVRGFIKV